MTLTKTIRRREQRQRRKARLARHASGPRFPLIVPNWVSEEGLRVLRESTRMSTLFNRPY